MDLVGLNRINMSGISHFRVKSDQGNRADSPTSVKGGRAPHAPPMNELEPAAGGAIDILQHIALTLQ